MSAPRRSWTMFLSPRWLAVHLLFLVVAVTMVLLGRWQLQVSDRKHFDLQNFSYVVQWWLFTVFVLYFWRRLIRDAWRPAAPQHSGGGLVVAGRSGAGPAELVSRPTDPQQAPIVYRGYVMPTSANTPNRSGGDEYHSAYNDYLWRLGMADSPGTPSGLASANPADVPAIDPGGQVVEDE